MSIPVMECNIVFSFFKNFDKAVNTFVNARDMHAFPIKINLIDTLEQVADIFTKALPFLIFNYLRKKMMGWSKQLFI